MDRAVRPQMRIRYPCSLSLVLIISQPESFVFCKQDGTPLNPDVIRKDILYPTLDRLSIPRPKGAAGFHCFRHSAASLINAETGNLKLTQKFLGHSNVSTTADIYTHTSEAMEREVAVVLERSIFGNLFPTVTKIGNQSSSVPNWKMKTEEPITLSALKKPPSQVACMMAWLRGQDLNLGPLGYENNKKVARPSLSSI